MAADKKHYDLIVLGAGAGGMTAATVAATEGLRVLLIEKSEHVGGTTAISGGMVWVPQNHLMAGAGLPDSRAAAEAYLAATVPEESARAALATYLDAAPGAIRYLCEKTEVRLTPVTRYPDYYPDLEGATLGGRVLEPEPFDGTLLGPDFACLRPPLQAFTILGGMMVARNDIPHFRNVIASPASFLRVVRLVVRHAVERLTHARGTSLVLGNALAGRLFLSARRAGVTFRLATTVDQLLIESGHCRGVRIDSKGSKPTEIRSGKGVVIATGGFSHDLQLRRTIMPEVADDFSATIETITGDGLRLATHAGATLDTHGAAPAFWVPVSVHTAANGRTVVYPHTVTDRAKPGVIAVDQTGSRFVNEAVSYHEFVRAMLRSPNRAAMRAHLLCDARFLWRYGLGAIKPFTRRLETFRRAGYLKSAATIDTLAAEIGVDAASLLATVNRYNRAAISGSDPDFGRGSDDYQRHLGDAAQRPNPCVAPIITPPFYAIELRPGDLGTAVGLRTDNNGRVLRANDEALAGLYAVGNDASSIMRGNYPGPGITLGPALTFGYLAGLDAAHA